MNLTNKEKQLLKTCIDNNEYLPMKYKHVLFQTKCKLNEQRPLFLYIVNELNTSHYKIGVSINVEKRIATMKGPSYNYVKLIYTKQIPRDLNVERHLHLKYKSKNIKGEWFNLTQSDIRTIMFQTKNPRAH